MLRKRTETRRGIKKKMSIVTRRRKKSLSPNLN